jgi:hypothetical protein
MTTYDQTHSRTRSSAVSREPVSVRRAVAIIASASVGIWGLIGWVLYGIL